MLSRCLLQAPLIRTMATISAHPLEDLVDVPVRLSVSGLYMARNFTLYATLSKKKMTFASCGHYVASSSGEIDVSQDCSLGGTYTGVEPMGLLWSMQQTPGQKHGLRFAKTDVITPVHVHVSLYPDHRSMEDIYNKAPVPLDSITLLRWYKRKDVTRTEIQDGDVRGTLFIPPGEGPFRGVIDMFGGAGGLIEFKASLLASRGFAVLSLAYFNYQDLTKNLEEVEFKYFVKAVDWLTAQPQVQSGGIGVVGVSKGGEIALWMAVHCPQISAVVNINGLPLLGEYSMKFGELELPSMAYDTSRMVLCPEGIVLKDAITYDEKCLVPIQKSRAKVLTLVGEDDQAIPPAFHKYHKDWLPEWKRRDIEIVSYPGAGHLIEPPFAPFCRASFNSLAGQVVVWGGQDKAHSDCQVLAWRKLQSFLKENVGDRTVGRTSSHL